MEDNLKENNQIIQDSMNRVFRKLRISVTDQCNFKCDFCMPTEPKWIPKPEILTFEEICRITTILANNGIKEIRLSGGEPLMRKGIEELVTKISNINGIERIGMTTNGYFLEEKGNLLKKAGLDTVTISLHSLKASRFSQITGQDVFDKILSGIECVVNNKLGEIKVNVVITRGCNDDEVLDFVEFARELGITIRFIEYMPFDGRKIWDTEIMVTSKEILNIIEKKYKLKQQIRKEGSTANNYEFIDGNLGSIATISSMTEPFCGDCDRVRLTADGKSVPCLFSLNEYDIRKQIRADKKDEELIRIIKQVLWKKVPGVETMINESSELNHIRPMHSIGG